MKAKMALNLKFNFSTILSIISHILLKNAYVAKNKMKIIFVKQIIFSSYQCNDPHITKHIGFCDTNLRRAECWVLVKMMSCLLSGSIKKNPGTDLISGLLPRKLVGQLNCGISYKEEGILICL